MKQTRKVVKKGVREAFAYTLAGLTDYLPSLQSGEALIIGEAISLPSLVKINMPDNNPSSTDIKYSDKWKEPWKDVDFSAITNTWKGQNGDSETS